MMRTRSRILRALVLVFAVLPFATPVHAQDAAPYPSGLWAAQTRASEITLRWDSVPDVTEYRLYQRVSDSEIRRIATPARTRTFWVVPLSSTHVGTRLQYQLSAVHPKLGESAIVPFNAVTVIAAPPSTPAAPAAVTAALTDSNEVTLRWDAVPGATAYAIGRSITPYGFSTLCTLCPTSTTYVDRAVTYGQGHTYTVEAITPGGRSRRTASNMVPVPKPGVKSGNLASGLVGILRSLLTAPPSSKELKLPQPPVTVSSAVQGNTVQLTWQAVAADSPSAFVVRRAINLGEFRDIASVTGDKREYIDRSLPQVFEGGRMRVAYDIRVRNRIGTSALGARTAVTVERPGASSPPSFCLVEYRRANTMWAQRGEATPLPGLESLRLNVAETKLFKTDWSYEGRRSDGRNYYGSHLRLLLNTGPREVTIFVRTLDPMVVFYSVDANQARLSMSMIRQGIKNTLALTATRRHGLFAALIKVSPGEVIGVSADLLEVVCPKI